jgi:hypothetical protein
MQKLNAKYIDVGDSRFTTWLGELDLRLCSSTASSRNCVSGLEVCCSSHLFNHPFAIVVGLLSQFVLEKWQNRHPLSDKDVY